MWNKPPIAGHRVLQSQHRPISTQKASEGESRKGWCKISSRAIPFDFSPHSPLPGPLQRLHGYDLPTGRDRVSRWNLGTDCCQSDEQHSFTRVPATMLVGV